MTTKYFFIPSLMMGYLGVVGVFFFGNVATPLIFTSGILMYISGAGVKTRMSHDMTTTWVIMMVGSMITTMNALTLILMIVPVLFVTGIWALRLSHET